MEAHKYNRSSPEVETGRSGVQDLGSAAEGILYQPGLHDQMTKAVLITLILYFMEYCLHV